MKTFLFVLFVLLALNLSICAARTGFKVNAYTADGKLVAVGDYSGQIGVYELATGREICGFSSGTNRVDFLEFTPDGKTLAVADTKSRVVMFVETTSGIEKSRLGYQNLSDFYNGGEMSISADGQTLWLIEYSATTEPEKIWQINLKNPALKSDKPLNGFSWSVNRTRTTAAYYSPDDKKIVLVAVNTGKEISRFAIDEKFVGKFNNIEMQISSAGDKIFFYRKYTEPLTPQNLAAVYTQEIEAVSAANGQILIKKTLPSYTTHGESFDTTTDFELNADGAALSVIERSENADEGVNDKYMTVYDAKTLDVLTGAALPEGKYNWYEISPDGRRFLTAEATGRINLYATGDGKKIGSLYPSQSAFQRLVVSPDETKLAAIALNGTVKIWTADGKEICKIETNLPEGQMLAFSPNGQNLLTVHRTAAVKKHDYDEDQNISIFKVWNAATGKLIREFSTDFYRSVSPGSFVVFTKQGDRIIADCTDDEEKENINLCVWNVNTGEFSARSFPVNQDNAQDNAISVFKLEDNQPFAFNPSPDKILAKNENSTREFIIWDLANEKLLDQTNDEAEAVKILDQSRAATVILMNSYRDETRNFWILQPDGKNDLNFSIEDLAVNFVHPNESLGAKFETEKAAPNGETGQTTTPSFDTSDEPRVFAAEPDAPKKNAQIFKINNAENASEIENLTVLKGHSGELTDLIFLKNTNRAITSSADRTVRIWDLATGKQTLLLK